MKKDLFKLYRSDRETTLNDRGGGVMLDVLKSPNPKVRKDHSHLSKNLLDRMKPEQSQPNEKKATHQH